VRFTSKTLHILAWELKLPSASQRKQLEVAIAMPGPKKYPKSSRRKDALHTVARRYAAVCLKKPREYWDDTLSVVWGSQEHYEVLKQVNDSPGGCLGLRWPQAPPVAALRHLECL
jgi:hypothetical protein